MAGKGRDGVIAKNDPTELLKKMTNIMVPDREALTKASKGKGTEPTEGESDR